jgi:hypothetical protein
MRRDDEHAAHVCQQCRHHVDDGGGARVGAAGPWGSTEGAGGSASSRLKPYGISSSPRRSMWRLGGLPVPATSFVLGCGPMVQVQWWCGVAVIPAYLAPAGGTASGGWHRSGKLAEEEDRREGRGQPGPGPCQRWWRRGGGEVHQRWWKRTGGRGGGKEEERREGHLTYKRAPHVSRFISAFLSSSARRVAKTAVQNQLRGLSARFCEVGGVKYPFF